MAAPVMEQNNHSSNDFCHLKRTDSSKSESPSEDGNLTDDVFEFVQKEIGGDLKSLKKVSGLLEKLTLENKQLEEQVNTATETLLTSYKCCKEKRHYVYYFQIYLFITICSV